MREFLIPALLAAALLPRTAVAEEDSYTHTPFIMMSESDDQYLGYMQNYAEAFIPEFEPGPVYIDLVRKPSAVCYPATGKCFVPIQTRVTPTGECSQPALVNQIWADQYNVALLDQISSRLNFDPLPQALERAATFGEAAVLYYRGCEKVEFLHRTAGILCFGLK